MIAYTHRPGAAYIGCIQDNKYQPLSADDKVTFQMMHTQVHAYDSGSGADDDIEREPYLHATVHPCSQLFSNLRSGSADENCTRDLHDKWPTHDLAATISAKCFEALKGVNELWDESMSPQMTGENDEERKARCKKLYSYAQSRVKKGECGNEDAEVFCERITSGVGVSPDVGDIFSRDLVGVCDTKAIADYCSMEERTADRGKTIPHHNTFSVPTYTVSVHCTGEENDDSILRATLQIESADCTDDLTDNRRPLPTPGKILHSCNPADDDCSKFRNMYGKVRQTCDALVSADKCDEYVRNVVPVSLAPDDNNIKVSNVCPVACNNTKNTCTFEGTIRTEELADVDDLLSPTVVFKPDNPAGMKATFTLSPLDQQNLFNCPVTGAGGASDEDYFKDDRRP